MNTPQSPQPPKSPPPETRRAVVLAGGKGTRLHPYTTILPKPLLPVGEHPILEHVLTSLSQAGFQHITISVGHLAELIQMFFGQGERWGVHLDYAIEDEPLGTIGPLSFIPGLGENFLVMNGDILSDIDLNHLWATHLQRRATLTIATYRRTVNIDFGVLSYDEQQRIHDFSEKPTIPYDVSMGIYVLNRRCLDYVPRGRYFGFDHLVKALLDAGEPVAAAPHHGQWLDLGRPEDYQRAGDLFNEQ